MEHSDNLCFCIHCGKPVSGDDAFCINCGKKIVPPAPPKPVCSACGAPLDDGDLFCVNCGAKAAPTATPASPPPPPEPACPRCSAVISEGDLFCIHCGAEISAPAQPEAAPAPEEPKQIPTPEPEHASQPMPEPASAPDPAPAPTPVTQKKRKKLPVVLSCAAVALLIAVCILLFPKNDNKPSQNSSTVGIGGIGMSEFPSPSTDLPGTDDTTAPDTGSGTEETGEVSRSYADLYIGTWAAEGTSVYDTANGWRALYLLNAEGETLTFSLEWVHSAPGSLRIFTDPITVTPVNGAASFSVTDSLGNKGTGSITITDSSIHIIVSITEPAEGAFWSIAMDAAFSPDPIHIKVAGNILTLTHEPYIKGRHIMFPMQKVFESIGIACIKDGNMTVGLTQQDTLLLEWYGDDSPEVSFNGTYLENILFEEKNGIVFAPDIALSEVFGLMVIWDAESKTLSVLNTVAKSHQIDKDTAKMLADFTADDAAARVQQAGYALGDAGNFCSYANGQKTWFIAVYFADQICYVSVTFDGEAYTLSKPTDSEGNIVSEPQPEKEPEKEPGPTPEPEPEKEPEKEPDPEPEPESPTAGLSASEQAVVDEFTGYAAQGGTTLTIGEGGYVRSGDGAAIHFTFGNSPGTFSYQLDRSRGEISVSAIPSRTALTEIANAAFLTLSGNGDSTAFQLLPVRALEEGVKERSAHHDAAAAARYGDAYTESVVETFSATMNADNYRCVFSLVHSYHTVHGKRADISYRADIQFYRLDAGPQPDGFPLDTPVELRLSCSYKRRNGESSEGIQFTALTATRSTSGTVTFTITYEAQQTFQVYAFNPRLEIDGINFTCRPGNAIPGKNTISFQISEAALAQLSAITVNFYNDNGVEIHGEMNDNTNWLYITEQIIDQICNRDE